MAADTFVEQPLEEGDRFAGVPHTVPEPDAGQCSVRKSNE